MKSGSHQTPVRQSHILEKMYPLRNMSFNLFSLFKTWCNNVSRLCYWQHTQQHISLMKKPECATLPKQTLRLIVKLYQLASHQDNVTCTLAGYPGTSCLSTQDSSPIQSLWDVLGRRVHQDVQFHRIAVNLNRFCWRTGTAGCDW